MKPLLLLLIFGLHWPQAPQTMATCKGGDPCKACRDCTQCRYCNSGQGSCSVKRDVEDRKYEEGKKKL